MLNILKRIIIIFNPKKNEGILKNQFRDQFVSGSIKFIWGVKSYDDLSDSSPSLYTMNDIDITYDDCTKKYGLSIETIYNFENKLDGQKKYLKNLLEAFECEFVNVNNWLISECPAVKFYINFGDDYYIETNSIKEMYEIFKWSVDEFCAR